MAERKSKSSSAKKPAKKETLPKGLFGKTALSQRNILIIGGVIAVVVLLVLFGRGVVDPIARYVPADAVLYVSIDLDELSSAEMEEIVTAFQAASGAPATTEDFDLIKQSFEGSVDVDYDADIAPWLGSQVGLGLLDLNMGALTGFSTPQFLVGIQSTNSEAADAFIAKAVANAEANGETVTSTDVRGTQVYVIEQSFSTQAMARAGGIVFLADSAETIETALTLNATDSMGSSGSYRDSTRELPGGRMVTAYMNMGAYMEALGSMSLGMGLPASSSGLEGSSVAMGVSVVPEGIQMDIAVVVDESAASPAMLEAYQAESHEAETVSRYPEDTLLFAGVGGAGGYDPETLRETMGEEQYQSYQDSMQMLQAMLGIDVENLLIAVDIAVDKEFSIAVFPQTSGIGQSIGVGLQAMVLTTKDAELANFFGELSGLVEAQLGLPLEQRTVAGMQSYVVTDPFSGQTFFAFGSGNGVGYFTTDLSLVESALDSSFVSLAESPKYTETWRAFSGSAVPFFYLDMAGFVEAIANAGGGDMVRESMAGMTPLTVIAGAVEPYRNGVIHMVIIAFIER